MKIKNGRCLHVVLFGTFGENKYFVGEYRNAYDIVGFNSNIIAFASEGVASFISQLRKKSYYIDPQTYAFQQPIKTIMKKNNGDRVLKKSIANLAKIYNSIIDKKVGKAPILAGSISKDEIKEICENILLFEVNIIQETIENLEEWEFLKDSGRELRPEFLISPYFYLEPDNLDKELEDNIEFINESKKIVASAKFPCKKDVFAEIVIDYDVLIDKEKVDAVVKKYEKCSPDGFLIWIDDFSETFVSETALKKYLNFLTKLNECNKPIIALRGSYFSMALAGKDKKLLAGVGHGIEYGEHRNIVPVGGGIPRAKFYFPKFHKRIDYHPDSQNVLLDMKWIKDKQTYLNNVCSCDMCKRVIKSDVSISFQVYGKTKMGKNGKAYPTADAMDKSRKHYLNTKISEYNDCASLSISEIIMKLKENQSLAEEVKKSHNFDHLKRWTRVLES